MQNFIQNFLAVAAAVVLLMPLAACGDDGAATQAAIKGLKTYYATNPSERGWVMTDVSVEEEGKLVIDMTVESENDLFLIKSSSRMKQFAIAKLGCPAASADVLQTLDAGQLLWVRLNEGNVALTKTICPHD